ncbi:hypothetical protein ACIQM3_03575 [Streptomyces sp. NPDC091271]|uniref:hypothetical protein n=1 Tax=Streptomyces sp. NPDC091271 TaxID=3365980 RepID=UPI0037F504A2
MEVAARITSIGCCTSANPVTGVLLGTLAAGEVLTVRQLGGLVLVLAGVVLGRPVARKVRAARAVSPVR